MIQAISLENLKKQDWVDKECDGLCGVRPPALFWGPHRPDSPFGTFSCAGSGRSAKSTIEFHTETWVLIDVLDDNGKIWLDWLITIGADGIASSIEFHKHGIPHPWEDR